MIRESTLQLINIIAILAMIISLPIHILAQAFLGVGSYADALTYGTVNQRYHEAVTVTLLIVLLAAASYHGLYGLRRTLLEIRSGRIWNRLVSTGTLAAGLVILGWGLRTVILITWGS